jgi:hypothetical protein
MFLTAFSYACISRELRTVRIAAALICAVAMVGIALDSLEMTPWRNYADFEGVLYAGVGREWWTDQGVKRLAGFGLASTDTCVVIGATGVLVLYLGRLPWIARAVTALVCIACMIPSQQSATVAAFILVALFALFDASRVKRARVLVVGALRWLPVAALGLCVVVPIAFAGVSVSGAVGARLYSLDDRALRVWPEILGVLSRDFALLLGRGLGGFGEPSQLSTNGYIPVPDNLFLNLALSFGVPIALALVAFSCALVRRQRLTEVQTRASCAVCALVFINGITANMVSNGAAMVFLGIAIAVLWKQPVDQDARTR